MFRGIREESKILRSLNLTWYHMGPSEMFTAIQNFICAIYGSKKKTINEIRLCLFYQKHQSQNKILDISTLPPCELVLFLHVKRANYIASIWKKSKCSKACLPTYYWPRLEWRWELNLDIWNIPRSSWRNFIRLRVW